MLRLRHQGVDSHKYHCEEQDDSSVSLLSYQYLHSLSARPRTWIPRYWEVKRQLYFELVTDTPPNTILVLRF